ncbi:hypothetical protein BH09MYX1_BH09MYX1_62280 [soil metagenome]
MIHAGLAVALSGGGREIFASELGDQGEAEVDAGRDNAGGDAVPIANDAPLDVLRAEARVKVDVRRVGRGLVAFEEAGATEQKRARADVTYFAMPAARKTTRWRRRS